MYEKPGAPFNLKVLSSVPALKIELPS